MVLIDEMLRTCVSCTQALLSTTLHLIGVGAILIVAKDFVSIPSEFILFRAVHHRASAFLIATSHQVFFRTSSICAFDLARIVFHNPSCRGNIIITSVHWIAAFISVAIVTHPIVAFFFFRIQANDKSTRTLICDARLQIAAAFRPMSVSAIPVIAMDKFCIVPVSSALWTFFHRAHSLERSTCLLVEDVVASVVLTCYQFGILPEYPSITRFVSVAHGVWETTVIAIRIVTDEAFAISIPCVSLLYIT
jgi:hypothetical protein